MAKKSKPVETDDRRTIAVDVNELRRTRDALATAFLALSSSIDRAVKAYIEHTDAVIAGDATLNVSALVQTFNAVSDFNTTTAGLRQDATQAAVRAQTPAPPSAQAPDVESEPVKGAKKKRVVKPRDPDAPKRPLTAYFRYLGEMRPKIAEELATQGGDHKAGELSIIATERWKEMSQEQHEPYHEAYRRDMVAYKAALADYIARTGVNPEVEPSKGTAKLNEPVAAPDVAFSDSSTDSDASDDDDDDDDDEEEIAPPPPPPTSKQKKSNSPEAVLKTPKSARKVTKAQESGAPMFSSINSSAAPPSSAPPPSSSAANKKRKSEAAENVEASVKKPRGRPPKLDTEESATAKPKKDKKKRLSEAA